MKRFTAELVTPNGPVFSGEVTGLRLPGSAENGSFAVLAGHAPLLSSLQPGVVELAPAQGERLRYRIGGGVVEVGTQRVTVLAESAELV